MRSEKKDLAVLILAGGLGTRMKSSLPKVLHPLGGKPVIAHILKTAAALRPDGLAVMAGHEAGTVKKRISESLPGWGIKIPVELLTQKELTGSGRAAREALGFLKKYKKAVILCGDAPLIKPETLKKMLRLFDGGAVLLSAEAPHPKGYGRILRAEGNEVAAIVEETDTDALTAPITEVNSGAYVFDCALLAEVIGELKPRPPKKEFYLTDAVELLRQKNAKTLAFKTGDFSEILGINSRSQLALAERILRERTISGLMENGVSFIDPQNAYVGADVKIGRDTVLYPGVFICGGTVIGENCRIGQNAYVENCAVGNGVELKPGCVLVSSEFADGCVLGPYAHVRPGCEVGAGAKIGNFTELKAAKIGRGSKVPHLSYVGDTVMGSGVNVGAGTITCNYDGKAKHKTVIGDGVFVGSNVNLVAPVTVGAGAKLGAGSTITDDVPPGALAIARARQITKWK